MTFTRSLRRCAVCTSVIVTGLDGTPFSTPLNVDANVTWAGYANEHIRAQIEPLLRAALERRDLWSLQ